jgi:hypothetical protein
MNWDCISAAGKVRSDPVFACYRENNREFTKILAFSLPSSARTPEDSTIIPMYYGAAIANFPAQRNREITSE